MDRFRPTARSAPSRCLATLALLGLGVAVLIGAFAAERAGAPDRIGVRGRATGVDPARLLTPAPLVTGGERDGARPGSRRAADVSGPGGRPSGLLHRRPADIDGTEAASRRSPSGSVRRRGPPPATS
ncbi:MAG TPA: hypothetical protein VHL53_04870 [Acidimicrobiia bacterium]|nr:hypothetical protein [Acidimicrobiia bacterium]